jgi:hypothetical protein
VLPSIIVGFALLLASASSFSGEDESNYRSREDATSVSGPLRQSLQNAIENQAARDSITVELRISGGAPSEAYHFLLRISNGGTVHYQYRDRLRGIAERIGTAELPAEEMAELLKQIYASGLIDAMGPVARLVPDTTVGMLEITDGRSHFRTWFAADAEQAEAQGVIPSPELMTVIEALYAIGREVVGVESVKT